MNRYISDRFSSTQRTFGGYGLRAVAFRLDGIAFDCAVHLNAVGVLTVGPE